MRFLCQTKFLQSSRNLTTARRMFVQKMNPVNGKVELIDVQDTSMSLQEGSDSSSIVKDLLSNTFYLDMLNDNNRNQTYYRALQKQICPGQRVLDIGTGSGILALMASKFLNSSSNGNQVIACESFPPMASLAQQVLAQNGAQEYIQVINGRSDDLDLSLFAKSFDVIVTEIFDSELIGEGLLSTLKYAVDHLVKDDFIIIPSHAVVYCQLVQSNILKLWKEEDMCPGWMHSLQEVQLSCLFPHLLKPLSTPLPILHVDLKNPPRTNQSFLYQIPVLDDGQVDGIVVWWDLYLDPQQELKLTTQPDWIISSNGHQQWRQHWKQCWAGVAAAKVRNGDIVSVKVHHDDLNIQLGILYSSNVLDDCNWKNYSTCLSWRRVWERNCQQRKSYYSKLCHEVIDLVHRQNTEKRVPKVLVLGEDSLFMEFLTKNCDITIAVENLPEFKRACHLHNTNDSQELIVQVRLLSDLLSKLKDTEESCCFDCVLSEPYFWSKENQEPWQHFVLFKQIIQQLHDIGVLSQNSVIYPNEFQISCYGVSLPELYRTRQPLNKILGWDLSILNMTLGAVGSYGSFAGHLWQCGGEFKNLTEQTIVHEGNLSSKEFISKENPFLITLNVTDHGVFDTLILQITYKSPSTTDFPVPARPTQEPHYEVYGICLLPKSVNVTEPRIDIELLFDHINLRFSATHCN